ncbi:MAG: hypothetical protein OEN20_05195 [Gammaproteobacteria bacterium]|nr:hypothetical protein [Gammaproteobacteria bacterium]
MRNALMKYALAALVALAASTASWATIIPIEDAVEAVALEVRLNDNLTGSVVGRSCEGCERKEFPITPQTQALENNIRVDLRRLRDRHGKPATIIYNIRSGEATRILWFR